MIKNLVFDFGGVIVSLNRDAAVQAFEQLGVADAEHILDKYHQTGIFLALEEGRLTEEEFRQQLGELCGRPLSFEEVQQAWLRFISGTDLQQLHYLETLRSRYRLYILSNTNPYISAWACSPQFTTDGKPLDAYFDGLFLSYRMGMTKPDRRIFRQLLDEAELQPEETLFVDDGASNIRAGQEAGMHTLLAENGCSWVPELKKILEKEQKL